MVLVLVGLLYTVFIGDWPCRGTGIGRITISTVFIGDWPCRGTGSARYCTYTVFRREWPCRWHVFCRDWPCNYWLQYYCILFSEGLTMHVAWILSFFSAGINHAGGTGRITVLFWAETDHAGGRIAVLFWAETDHASGRIAVLFSAGVDHAGGRIAVLFWAETDHYHTCRGKDYCQNWKFLFLHRFMLSHSLSASLWFWN